MSDLFGEESGENAHKRAISAKQRAILNEVERWGYVTLDQAVSLIGRNLYCNAHKHVGATLSRMVARGMIERVKPGVFRLPR